MHPGFGSNRAWRAAVTPRIRVAVVTMCLLVHGCDTVRGGAVELSWKLRPASSATQQPFARKCERDSSLPEAWGPIAKIRLDWTKSDGTCPSPPCDDAWNCDDNHGATGFVLPDGLANLSITPECAIHHDDGSPDTYAPAAPGSYIAPALVQRDVIRGEIVSLDAIELVVVVTDCARRTCICGTAP